MSGRVPRIVAGRDIGPVARGAICTLALHLRDKAQQAGLIVAAIEASRIRNSGSRYLHLRDPQGRSWTVRVSNHYRPNRTGHREPNFDFVSLDGVSGLDQAADYIARIARGEITWRQPALSPRRKGVRR